MIRTSFIGRAVAAQDMTVMLGRSVVVEDRAGANSPIATDAVAWAAPDGHSIIASTLSHDINPILMPDQATDDGRWDRLVKVAGVKAAE